MESTTSPHRVSRDSEISPTMAKEKEPVKVADPAKKKKKKNAPDRPQPAWMFPPDEENPILNPKVMSEEQKRKEEEEREQAIKFLKYKSVSAPLKAAPPAQLLSLVGAFLTSYGFNSTSRIYTTELNARKKLDDWDNELGKKFDKGMPGLVKIYKDWHNEWQERRELKETSSEEEDDAATKATKSAKGSQKKLNLSDDKAKAKSDETSSSGSSNDSSEVNDLDVDMEDVPAASKVAKKAKNQTSSSGTSSSSSDSDADDEKDTSAPQAIPAKPTVNGLVNKLKRKGSLSESSSSSFDSDSDSVSSGEAGNPPAKKTKVDSKKMKVIGSTPAQRPAPAAEKSKTKASSSSSSSSDSDSDANQASKPLPASSSDDSSSGSDSDGAPAKTVTSASKTEESTGIESRKTSTGSSATIEAGSPKRTSASSSSSSATSDSSSSDSDDSGEAAEKSKNPEKSANSTGPATTNAMKRKLSTSPNVEVQTPKATKLHKKQNTPFSRISQGIKVDPNFASNAYVPYDYAQRAHEDLIITKGKGFTKEKNKKKR